MNIAKLIQTGLKVANKLTQSAQCDVVHYPWVSSDVEGAMTYGTAVTRKAIVEYKTKQFPSGSGQLQLVRAIIYFLEPFEENGAAGRIEPLDTRDKLVLPDGTTGPILSVDGLGDPTTDHPYYYAVNLGWFIR